MIDNKSYGQLAIDRWFSNPDRHKPTVLGQTVKMVFEHLTTDVETEGTITHEQAAELILKGLSNETETQIKKLKKKEKIKLKSGN